MKPLKVLDLFSGIGGFSLGLERTGGFETVAFCEVSPKCRFLLNYHWPNVPQFTDVRTLKGTDVGEVEVICGGFPCQDISFAGRGAGLAGERSGLWSEYARLVGELRPCLVIVENVSALLVRGMGTVLGDLAALGYGAWWDCIPACAVGAPHRRDRLWIVAYAGSLQHQGFGDALRRAIGAELPRADADEGLSARFDNQAKPQRSDSYDAGPHRAQIHQRRDIELRDEQDSVPGSLGKDVAHAYLEPRDQRRLGDAREGAGGRNADRGCERPHLADAGGAGLAQPECETIQREGRRQERRATSERGWWATEPDVGRVAHGVPARVDRLHGLGNAVVPQIPELIGRAVLEALA